MRRWSARGPGSVSGDREPLSEGSPPQVSHRRHARDPPRRVARPRSSSGSPAPDPAPSSGYQSTDETDKVERSEASDSVRSPMGPDSAAAAEEDPRRAKRAVAQLQRKILKLGEQIKIQQTARDDNVAEYLQLANRANKQQSARIKQVFEKKNHKSAQSIQQLQRKLDHSRRKLREAQRHGIPRRPKDLLRDVRRGLRDVGAKVTGFGEGVVGGVKGGLCSLSHSAAVVSKPREMASLIRNKLGSADNIAALKDEPSAEEGAAAAAASPRPLSSPRYCSEDDRSSATSGSAGDDGAAAPGGPPGSPPGSRGNAPESPHHPALDLLLQELRELRGGQAGLEESLDALKTRYRRDYALVARALQEERFRCERLEEQLNDLTELHQNEILNLKQELASMEEKMAYRSDERARDIQEALEACQTRISKMELQQQQQQQQAAQLEGLEKAAARTLLGKVINVLLALTAVLLVFVSTVANCAAPLMRTRSRSLAALLLVILAAFLWRNRDALSCCAPRAPRPPG
ncbi:transmembrane and coiled-coil domains protein 1-like [Hippocampus zosterae]|uniref:transmembrane and coiled-coil domains protein 1-like n=1 Tax=Hippocampus zosterae TaxID=109293 RepID=UPI00223DF6CB|nr:transmembrane and coiled-coil domains protein 1-like [Hippocampus zosterae]